MWYTELTKLLNQIVENIFMKNENTKENFIRQKDVL